ncbi:hypothetical protein Syun_016268 [Stephania yunnanensis]|uniref:Reverse transcriptase zinc-binding domain-containing protein n=1 Tax=Stephania yunnanensis TaxID=152371 RepID=A0AAP0J781_9MAGN
MVWLGKINTMDVLQRRCLSYSLLPSRCSLCHSNYESMDHVLLVCPFACRIWEEMLRELGLLWHGPQSLASWLEQATTTIAHENRRNILCKAGTNVIFFKFNIDGE